MAEEHKAKRSTLNKFKALCCSCCRKKVDVVAEAEENTDATSNEINLDPTSAEEMPSGPNRVSAEEMSSDTNTVSTEKMSSDPNAVSAEKMSSDPNAVSAETMSPGPSKASSEQMSSGFNNVSFGPTEEIKFISTADPEKVKRTVSNPVEIRKDDSEETKQLSQSFLNTTNSLDVVRRRSMSDQDDNDDVEGENGKTSDNASVPVEMKDSRTNSADKMARELITRISNAIKIENRKTVQRRLSS